MTSTERRHLRMVGREQVDLVTSTSILMISSKDLMRPSVAFLVIDTLCICLTSLTRAKCGTRSTLCWKVGNISGSTELFAL